MLIDMTEQERQLLVQLVQLVQREISELGPEIRRTRTASVRDSLKEQKLTCRHLLDHLRTGTTAAQTGA
jgi:hypothetical protein